MMTIAELALIIAKWDGRPWHSEDYLEKAKVLWKITNSGDVDEVNAVFEDIQALLNDKATHTLGRHSFADFFREVISTRTSLTNKIETSFELKFKEIARDSGMGVYGLAELAGRDADKRIKVLEVEVERLNRVLKDAGHRGCVTGSEWSALQRDLRESIK